MIKEAAVRPVPRRATKPSNSQKRERLEGKKRRSGVKELRRSKPSFD